MIYKNFIIFRAENEHFLCVNIKLLECKRSPRIWSWPHRLTVLKHWSRDPETFQQTMPFPNTFGLLDTFWLSLLFGLLFLFYFSLFHFCQYLPHFRTKPPVNKTWVLWTPTSLYHSLWASHGGSIRALLYLCPDLNSGLHCVCHRQSMKRAVGILLTPVKDWGWSGQTCLCLLCFLCVPSLLCASSYPIQPRFPLSKALWLYITTFIEG